MRKLYFCGDIKALCAGIDELSRDYGFAALYENAPDAITVSVRQKESNTLSVSLKNGCAEIVYTTRITFFRALGQLLMRLDAGESAFSLSEPVKFSTNGPMFDVSQGHAVITVPTVKRMLRQMALMGLSMLMMYCEDSYDVPGQPYFGYMRSRYSEADMRELDAYADLFGIEMIPCIQTLAHLISVLKWKPYKDFIDDMDTLLVGDERTYAFIRDMLVAASRPFKTKRIHIGMDEAMMLGQGNYLKKNGYVPPAKILREHLERVMEIVRELGLQPMMWSDMFMRVLNENSDSYYSDAEVTDEVKNSVPRDATLVYWDYYHDNIEFYEKYIDKHRIFGEPVFAGGIWTWMGFGPNYTKTIVTTNPALIACKNKGIREIIATVWGDNGTECSVLATLPMLQLFAEHGYTEGEVDEAKLKASFKFICRADYDDFLALQYLDEVPGVPEGNWRDRNCSKPLMWQDILTGLVDYNFRDLPLNAHYEALAERILPMVERNGDFADFFRMCYEVAHVLSIKAEAGIRLTAAYKAGDKAELARFVGEYLPELRRRVAALREAHMVHWFRIYKPLGWDIYDLRYGGVLTRIDSAITEIKLYLDGKLSTIAELEEERLPYHGDEGVVRYANYYGKVVSPSRIDPKPLYPHYLG